MSRPAGDALAETRPVGLRVLRGLAALAVVGVLALLWLRWDQAAFLAWKQQVGLLPYFLLMAVLPAFGLPITPFFIVAGATFGIAIGLAGSLLALALNLSLAYWIAQTGLRRFVLALLKRFEVSAPDFADRRDRALGFILLVRFTPGPPAFVKNYLLGAAAVPFGLYLGVSMLISGVYALGFVVLGESALEGDPLRLGLGLVLLLAAAGLVWGLRRRFQR